MRKSLLLILMVLLTKVGFSQDSLLGRRVALTGVRLACATPFFAMDRPLNELMLRNHSHFNYWTTTYVLEPFGSGKYSLPLLAGFTAWGYYSGDSRFKMAGLEGFFALGAAGVVTQIPKTLAHRRRPYMGEDPFVFLGPKSNGTVSLSLKNILNRSYFSGDYRSYWSGHTAAAFATATSIALNFKDKPWVGCVAYGMAGLVGVSRMYQSKHWSSDVVFGALCGWGCAQVVHRRRELLRYIPGVKPKDYLTY